MEYMSHCHICHQSILVKYSPLTPGDLVSLKEVAVTPTEDTGHSSAAPANTVRFADLSFKRSYSYGVLEKKWSL